MAEQEGKAVGTKRNICVCDRTRALGRRPPRRKKQRYCIYNISIVSLQYLRKAKDYSRRRKVYCTKNRDTKIYKASDRNGREGGDGALSKAATSRKFKRRCLLFPALAPAGDSRTHRWRAVIDLLVWLHPVHPARKLNISHGLYL